MTTSGPETGDLAPYALVPVGFEATYVSESELSEVDQSDSDLEFVTDEDGNVAMCYSLWGFAHATEDKWDDEIRAINRMQTALGPLPDDTRRIRAHIGSFVGCDNGVPVTIDELLNAIGTGKLPSPAFHNGCWLCGGRAHDAAASGRGDARHRGRAAELSGRRRPGRPGDALPLCRGLRHPYLRLAGVTPGAERGPTADVGADAGALRVLRQAQ